MPQIAESELIITKAGAVYHLNLRPDEIAPLVITVGDPARVERVSRHFDSIEHKVQHRELVTHTGYIGKKRLSVVSTGMGPDNIDIVMNELDALVNIDFKTRTVKPQLQTLNIIRLGTAGSLQADIPVDSFVASTHGLGIDNLMHFYRLDQNEEERELLQAFTTHTQLKDYGTAPYISSASPSLLRHFVDGFHQGITVTCPGFYGPQGRVLRLGLRYPNLIGSLTEFRFGRHKIANFEMETSALYGMSRLLHHHCLSLSAIVANRVAGSFSANAQDTVDKMIFKTIDTITSHL